MDNPPMCTKEEMWCSDEKWAVMKEGNKKATKLFDNKVDSFKMASTNGKYYVQHRPAERKRCAEYCGVNKWCESYKQYLEVKNGK